MSLTAYRILEHGRKAFFRGDRRTVPETFLWIALLGTAICLRMPSLMQGRFWAEDGHPLYSQAWTLPWSQALLAVDMGYLNLAGNAAGVLARYAGPVETAPFVTLAVSLVLQSLPGVILITARDNWLSERWVLGAALLYLAIAPAAEEVWLNTANSQFHMLLAASLLLCLDAPQRGETWPRLGILFFAPLCGPAPLALLPVSLARALLARSRARLAQTLALTCGLALQFGLFCHGRGVHLAVRALASAVYVKQLLVPVLGEYAATPAQQIALALSHGVTPVRVWVGVLLLCIGLCSVICLSALRQPRSGAPFWLIATATLLLVASYFGAIGGPIMLLDGVAGERYSFAPQTLLILGLLAASRNLSPRLAAFPLAAVVWTLAAGAVSLARPSSQFFSTGPNWQEEVRLWRRDPARELRIWPAGSQWVIHIHDGSPR